MQTKLSQMTSILILATFVLVPAWSSGAGAKKQVVSPGNAAAPPAGTTELISVASDGTQGNNNSYDLSISPDGRYVAFSSTASNLVDGDTNDKVDIFVHDRETGITERVSIAGDGSQGNGNSWEPSISANGRYVSFKSGASNLVSGDTNIWRGIFVHDRQSGSTTDVSRAYQGSQADDLSYSSSISKNGRYVVFTSRATNLVPGDTNNDWDVFVHDRQTGITERVSVASDGSQGNDESSFSSISADGRYVAFESEANNLISWDTNGRRDIFVHDRQTGRTRRVSVASDGSQVARPSRYPFISADGRYVAFASEANNLVKGHTNDYFDIFVHDMQTASTTLVSLASDGTQGNDNTYHGSISADGRYVAFESPASNLVNGDTNAKVDIFVHDRQTGFTERVSIASDGSQGNNSSGLPSISADGRYVAFNSSASNLVVDDTNESADVFVLDRGEGPYAFEVYLPISRNQR